MNKDKIKYGPRNATYTSAGILNLILAILGNMVKDAMCNEIKEVKIFSLLVDETKDISKQEQMSIVVRYTNSEGVLHEHFLTYVQAVSLIAESLTNDILNTLCRFDLDPRVDHFSRL